MNHPRGGADNGKDREGADAGGGIFRGVPKSAGRADEVRFASIADEDIMSPPRSYHEDGEGEEGEQEEPGP
jgi:hypothetical protein